MPRTSVERPTAVASKIKKGSVTSIQLNRAITKATVSEAEAATEIANALHRLADVGEKGLEVITPAVQFFGEASMRLDHLCRFLRKWGPWIMASVPFMLMLIGAITPSAATHLDAAIRMLFGG